MKKRKSTNNFSAILSSLFILLLVGGAVGFLFIFTENFTTPLKNFYVTCGNDDFISDRENFDIILGKEYKFEITNTLGGADTGYLVNIAPNVTSANTFAFKVGGTTKNYNDIESLTKGFSIVAYEDYFSFTATMDLPEILQLYYSNNNITEVPTALNTDIPYFRLVISSTNYTETININFNIKSEI